MLFVKPGINPETGEQFRVRIPHTFALMNPAGESVPDSPFWRWMLRHEDIVDGEPPKPPAAAEAQVEQPAAEAAQHDAPATPAPIAEH